MGLFSVVNGVKSVLPLNLVLSCLTDNIIILDCLIEFVLAFLLLSGAHIISSLENCPSNANR